MTIVVETPDFFEDVILKKNWTFLGLPYTNIDSSVCLVRGTPYHTYLGDFLLSYVHSYWSSHPVFLVLLGHFGYHRIVWHSYLPIGIEEESSSVWLIEG